MHLTMSIAHPYSKLTPEIWLSATEGDIGDELGKLDHWPEGVEAKEGVWRDYYTGEQLENYTKPWISSNGDEDMRPFLSPKGREEIME